MPPLPGGLAIPADAPLFFLTCAEHSADALAAALIESLKKRYPNARFVGVGGDKMAAAGCRLLSNSVRRSAMLVGALLTESRYWFKMIRQIREELQSLKPDVVIPIDSSFINMRIAREAKELGFPVCYYVAPQLWASRPWRVKKLKGIVDTLCCVLPFEEKYFCERGVRAVYVGHPMFDTPADTPDTDPLALDPPLPGVQVSRGTTRRITFDPAPDVAAGPGFAPRVAIFPGSRRAEIDKHMPAMLEILSEIKGRFPKAQFVASAPSEERLWQMRKHLRGNNLPIDLRANVSDAVMRWADFILTKSGTSTLQAARHGKPMVVMFAVRRYEWAIAKHFITTPYITLVNILAGRELVPEYIPFYGSPLPVARECIHLLSNKELRTAMTADLQKLVEPLQPRHGKLAADRVAEQVALLVKNA